MLSDDISVNAIKLVNQNLREATRSGIIGWITNIPDLYADSESYEKLRRKLIDSGELAEDDDVEAILEIAFAAALDSIRNIHDGLLPKPENEDLHPIYKQYVHEWKLAKRHSEHAVTVAREFVRKDTQIAALKGKKATFEHMTTLAQMGALIIEATTEALSAHLQFIEVSMLRETNSVRAKELEAQLLDLQAQRDLLAGKNRKKLKDVHRERRKAKEPK